MAKSDPTMLRVSSTLLQELINENIMLKIIADRRNYVSSLTKGGEIAFLQRDEADVESLDVEGLNELSNSIAAEFSQLKRVYWLAWNLKKDVSSDMDKRIDAQRKRVDDSKKFNAVSSRLASDIASCAENYVETVLPAFKNCAKVCECFAQFLGELRKPCQKSFESARSMKLIEPELEFAPGSDPLVRIALVGNAMNKVLKIMEKYKENENVARFPILHSMGEMDNQNVWEDASGSSWKDLDAETENAPEVSSVKLPYEMGEMDKDEAVVDATGDKECVVETGRNSPPQLQREDDSHSRKGKSRGGRGARSDPSTSGGRGPKKMEVCEAELETKRKGSGRRGNGDKGVLPRRPGLRDRSQEVSYVEIELPKPRRRSGSTYSSKEVGRADGRTAEKRDDSVSGRSSRGRSELKSISPSSASGVSSNVGSDDGEQPCSSNAFQGGSSKPFVSRRGKQGSKCEFRSRDPGTWSENEKWAVEWEKWPKSETVCRLCKDPPTRNAKAFRKHMAEVHHCGDPLVVKKICDQRLTERAKRAKKRVSAKDTMTKEIVKKSKLEIKEEEVGLDAEEEVVAEVAGLKDEKKTNE